MIKVKDFLKRRNLLFIIKESKIKIARRREIEVKASLGKEENGGHNWKMSEMKNTTKRQEEWKKIFWWEMRNNKKWKQKMFEKMKIGKPKEECNNNENKKK